MKLFAGLVFFSGVAILLPSHSPQGSIETKWQRTILVDPDHGVTGNISDAATIQDGIDEVLTRRTDHDEAWTVLVNPGEYEVGENDDPIELSGTNARNISIVGVNPESCIINVTSSGVPGIKITSGTEDVRNNAIRNLTIKTSNGHGIEIVKGQGGSTPKGITIQNCIIRADGTGARGIEVHTVEDLFVLQSEVRSDDAQGVHFESGQGSPAQSLHKNVVFDGCTISGKDIGAEIQSFTAPFVIRNCTVEARGPSSGITYGVRYDKESSLDDVLEVTGCRITAINDALDGDEAIALYRDPGSVRCTSCTLEASTAAGAAYGLKGGTEYPSEFEFVGCVFLTSCADEKQTEVYDLQAQVGGSASPNAIIRGCLLSKWIGPVLPWGPPQTQVQRMLNVSAASDTAVHSGIQLSGSEQEVTTGITNPDAYRALQVTGVGIWSGSADVFVIGTNLAGDAITEKFTITSLQTNIIGKKPFKTVTKIIVPAAEQGQSQTIKVGTTDKLGLSSPLSSTSDVLQWSKVSGSAWQIQAASALTVDVNHATINPGSISTGDSFEFTHLTAG